MMMSITVQQHVVMMTSELNLASVWRDVRDSTKLFEPPHQK